MVVERAYDYSRGLIENWITSYLVTGGQNGESDARSQEITDQLLKVYDELYLQLWVNRNQTSNQVSIFREIFDCSLAKFVGKVIPSVILLTRNAKPTTRNLPRNQFVSHKVVHS